MRRSYFPGMQLRAVAYEVQGAKIGVVPDVLEMTVTTPMGKTPTLSMTYAPGPKAVRGGVLEREVEVAIEATFDGNTWEELPDARFVTQKTEHNLVNDGTHSRKVEAIHVSDYLKEALVWSVPEVAKDKDGKYKFLSRNAGTIISTIWGNATKRGWGPGLTLDANIAKDSAGQDWEKVVTLHFDPTITLLQIVDSLRSLGMIDTVWQGRTLKVYNADKTQARDLTESKRWPLATSLAGAPEVRTWSDMCTDVLVKGEGGLTWLIHNDLAPRSMRRVEKVVEAGGVELETTARMVAEATLKSGAHVSEEIKREWVAADVHLLPWVDYRLGDWLMVERSEGMERLQVAQVSVTQKDGMVTGHTTFGTVLDSLLGRLTKRTKGIVGLATTGGSGVRPAPPASKYWPLPPQGLSGSSSVVIKASGWPAAIVNLTWSKVETDTLGSRVDVRSYEISWEDPRYNVKGAGSVTIPAADSPSVAIPDLEVDTTYIFRVRATTSDATGSWSAPFRIHTATDGEPPPVPSKPVLSQSLGILDVYWDGRGAQGQGMPADFAGVEVSVQLPGVPASTLMSLPTPLQRTAVAGLEIKEYEVRLRSYDRAGNKSDWSAPARIALEQSIDTNKIVRSVEEKLAASDVVQRAAREEALKQTQHLSEAMTRVALSLVETGPYPPDRGEVDKSQWVSPDARVFTLRKKGD
jgi:fibronectin, type III domain protein|nr:MAG TPA: FN3 [Caudoviricetes sp.]